MTQGRVMIRDFQVFGDLHRLDDRPKADMWRVGPRTNGYCPGDLIHLRQPRNQERIRASMPFSPCPINLYVLANGGPRVGDHQHARLLVDDHIGRSCVQDDAITFVMSSNLTGPNTLPFTPWIVAHRLMHAYQFRGFHNSDNAMRCAGVGTKVRALLGDHLNFVQFKKNYVKWTIAIAAFMTVKSARDFKLFSDLDIESEFMAQVLCQGEVKFISCAQIPERMAAFERACATGNHIYSKGEWPVVFEEIARLRDEIGDERLDTMLRGLALEIEASMLDLLLGMRGDVHTF